MVYMFIFYQSAHLTHLNLQQFHEGKPIICTDWLPWVRKGDTGSSFSTFVGKFMYVAFSVILGKEPKRMPYDIRPYLQPGEE